MKIISDSSQHIDQRMPSRIESIDNIPFIEIVNAVRFEEEKFERQRKAENATRDTAALFDVSHIGEY